MAKHTAVNWILIELQNKFPKEIGNAYEANQFLFEYLFEKAKAMEREQLRKCYEHAMLSLLDTGHGDSFEDYYNKTFKDKIWHNKQTIH
jgi:hypothetical protein